MSENTNAKKNNDPILILRDLTPDEYKEYLSEMREKALHDEVSALAHAKREGKAEGKAEGREEERIRLVENLRKIGVPEEQIKKALEM